MSTINPIAKRISEELRTSAAIRQHFFISSLHRSTLPFSTVLEIITISRHSRFLIPKNTIPSYSPFSPSPNLRPATKWMVKILCIKILGTRAHWQMPGHYKDTRTPWMRLILEGAQRHWLRQVMILLECGIWIVRGRFDVSFQLQLLVHDKSFRNNCMEPWLTRICLRRLKGSVL